MRFPQRLTGGYPFLAVLFAVCWPGPLWSASRTFEYLYVNASEGSASGGHAAVRFGEEVFHFQHVPPGLVRLTQDDFDIFRYQYGYQENRTIRAHRIEVDEDTFAGLKRAFSRRLLVQDEQFAELQSLERDLWLVGALQGLAGQGEGQSPSATAPTIELKALGYFFNEVWQAYPAIPPRSAAADLAASSLQSLRQAIAAAYGEDFLAVKRRQTWDRLQALTPDLRNASEHNDVAEDRFSPAGSAYAKRYADLMTNLAALEVLERGLPPRRDAIQQPAIAETKLAAETVARLGRFQEALMAELLALLRSERADWGYPMLVGMARLHALERSIRLGYLAILDRLDAGKIDSPSDQAGSGFRSQRFEQARQAFAVAKADLSGAAPLNERRYAQLEEAANLFLEIRNGMTEARPARLFPAGATPSRPAAAALIRTAVTATQLADYRDALRHRRDSYAAALLNLYRYELLGRNCVTELFRVINQSVAQRAEGEPGHPGSADPAARMSRIRAASRRLLGGYVDEMSVNLIPFVSFHTVGQTFRVRASYDLPAYREEVKQREYQQTAPVLVDLQESNVLSSAIYRWHGDDAAFLFFTQDAVWSRPLLGSFNLAVALGQAVSGVITLPWDEGETLQKSMKGIFVSLPELFFFNIRKGSFPHVPWVAPTGHAVPD